MADFPPNVDDTRLWLTSSSTFNDVIPTQLTALQSRVTSSDDLAHRLTALTILKQRRGLGFPRFRPPVRIGDLNSQYCYYTGLGYGSGVYHPGTEVHSPYPFPNPVQLQGQVGGDGGFQESRARALRRPQNQAQIRNQNKILQYQGAGIAPIGGSERVSGGTGVFHPRVLDSSTTRTTMSTEAKKKPESRSKQESKGIQQRNSTNKCVGMGEEHHQLLPDVVLPPEWTY